MTNRSAASARSPTDDLVLRGRQRVERVRALLQDLRRDGHPEAAALAERLLSLMFKAQDLLHDSRDLLQAVTRRNDVAPARGFNRTQSRAFRCNQCGLEAVVQDGPGGRAIDYETDGVKNSCGETVVQGKERLRPRP